MLAGYLDVQPSPDESDLRSVAHEMFVLMVRNVTTAGVVYSDPAPPKHLSAPGCVLASPSFPLDPQSGKQNYVNNWTRDAAITMIEITAQGAAHPDPPIAAEEVKRRMADYVTFADTCQRNAPPHKFSIACFRIDGQPRCDADYQNCWSTQGDGPALQTLAILGCYPSLDSPIKATARTVIERNLRFLLVSSEDNVPNGLPGYQATTTSPWEEETGYSFFARAAQLKCLRAIQEESFDITVPGGLAEAITWLEGQLDAHWDNDKGYYCTFEPGTTVSPPPADNHRDPYDPNSDILMACVYGAVPATDPKLLATAAKIRDLYTDQNSTSFYPINGPDADATLGYGPMIGRYPGDYYDGDVTDDWRNKDHPWALCTCNLGEIYYRLANTIENDHDPVPTDPIVEQFYQQIGLAANPDEQAAVPALRKAGDSMLKAIVFHSDNLELSEQFDQATGFEKSVSNLTWSYASFLSAVRNR
jgi:glucoamylase